MHPDHGRSRLTCGPHAQHGFAVHHDPMYRDPQIQKWQAFVIRSVAEWLTTFS